MDPITSAARAFLAEAKAFWRARPERVLPIIAEPSERGEMVKALRLAELAPENRRPLFLYEAPFVDACTYFDGVLVALVPENVANAAAWRGSVDAMNRMSHSPPVRLAVYAPPGGPLNGTLGDRGARFHFNQATVLAY